MAAKTRQLAPRTVAALDSLSAMWAEIDKCREPVLLDRPANSFTVAEYAQRYKVASSTAERQVARMVRNGKATQAKCLITAKDARRRAVNVYVLQGA